MKEMAKGFIFPFQVFYETNTTQVLYFLHCITEYEDIKYQNISMIDTKISELFLYKHYDLQIQ